MSAGAVKIEDSGTLRSILNPPNSILLIADLSYRSARVRLDAFAREARSLGWLLRLHEPRGAEAEAVAPDCAGVFLCNAELTAEAMRGLAAQPRPVLEASRKQCAPWPQVFVDEDALAAIATAHFRILQRIHYGYLGRAGHLGSQERAEALRRALPAEAESYTALDLQVGTSGQASAVAVFLQELPRPACLLCHEDRIANTVIEQSQAQGLRIPEEIAVLSCGDDPLLSSLSEPSLSSIVFPSEIIGRESARILDRLIRTQEKPEAVIRIPPEDVHIRGSTDESASEDPILAKAVGFVRQHLSETLSTDSIARHAGISRRGLEVRFREKLDMTVQDYIRKRRMMEAAFLLRSTNLTLETISEHCGYTSASSFSRAFKSIHGFSPSHLRDSSL